MSSNPPAVRLSLKHQPSAPKSLPRDFPTPPLSTRSTSVVTVLAVGLAPAILHPQGSLSQSASYLLTPANSMRDAVARVRDGDFDLILIGDSVPAARRQCFAQLLRDLGLRVPLVYVTASPADLCPFADVTIPAQPSSLLRNLREVLAAPTAKPPAATLPARRALRA